MTTNPFKKATRSQSKLRMAIMGASGSGKSYTALKIASGLGSKIAAIDTERGSLSKYAGLGVEFDVLELTDYNPRNYINAIQAAVANGYDVLVIDSLSHAWSGTGGILETVDKVAKRSQSNNSFAAWRDVTPLHNQLVDTILGAGIHIIVTMRSKTEYVMEKNERTGKTEPRKVGLAPVQRDGMEYEFDVCAEMDTDHNFTITKTRCIDLDNAVITKPDAQLGETLKTWLSDGEVVAQKPAQPVETVTPVDNAPKATETVTPPEIVEAQRNLVDAADNPLGTLRALNEAAKDDPLNWVEEFREETGATVTPLFFETQGVRVGKRQDGGKTLTFTGKDGTLATAFSRDVIKGVVPDDVYERLNKVAQHSLPTPVRVYWTENESGYKNVTRVEKVA